MKRNIIIFFTIGLFLALGCEKLPIGNAFLEKAPGVDVTKDTVFKNLDNAERFLWGAYRTIRYGLNTNDGDKNLLRRDLLASLTDETQSYLLDGGAVTLYYSGQYSAATENNNTKYNLTGEGAWDGIRRSYLFIENIDKVPDVDPAYRSQMKAEALMVIACHYTDMLRNLGGVPWLNHSYTPTEVFDKIPRMTAQAQCDSIVALCDRAGKNLPWTVINPVEWDGRFTRAAAMGLKARVLLFNASPLFNSATPYLDGDAAQQHLTWHGGYDHNLWKQAMDASYALITEAEATGDYRIYHKVGNSYRKDFQEAYYLRGNGEQLISIRDRFKSPTSGSTDYYIYASATWGCGLVTHDFVQIFPMANGIPINELGSGYDPANPYLNRDPRMYETAVVNGDSYKGRTAELWIGGQERRTVAGTSAATGYPMRKFLLESNTATSYGSIVHWPYLRMAEIYLSYAEASNEFNNGPDAEAYRCVNIIRSRVGLADLKPGLTKEQFREAVITERACELAFEEVRWYDIIRWKRESDFTKRLHGMNVRRTGSAAPYTYTYEVFECPVRYWMQAWSPKWYLSAFPSNEINKGYGLVQNPGWE